MNPQPRRSADPSFTFAIALVLSLALWWASFRAVMAGTLDITDGGLRYLAALALSWCAVYGIATLVANYGHESPKPPAASAAPQRRASDQPEAALPAESEEAA